MKKKKVAGILCLTCAVIISFGILGTVVLRGEPERDVPENASESEVLTISDDDKALLSEESEQQNLNLAVKAAVLMDAETGKVIYKENEHKELPPASVTKVMTMLLTMEAVEAGKVKLTDNVTISERAASMGGSQMYMEVGETHTLEELLEGIAIVSANDACVAVAEYVAGSEEVFVEKMNKRAKELGMRDTNFVNTNGLPVAEHYTSAYDIALMSQLLLKFEEPKKWFNTWQKTITVGLPGKEKEFGLTNTNKLIRHYEGANGLKTGFTAEAGYCLSASATRDETTLIAVVLGAETSKTRNGEVAKLLNYGFANYKSVPLAEKNQKMKKVRLAKGNPEFVNAITTSRITAFLSKGDAKEAKCKVTVDDSIKLPLSKGTKIGTAAVYVGDEKVSEYDLVSDADAKKASFFTYYGRMIKRLLPSGRD